MKIHMSILKYIGLVISGLSLYVYITVLIHENRRVRNLYKKSGLALPYKRKVYSLRQLHDFEDIINTTSCDDYDYDDFFDSLSEELD